VSSSENKIYQTDFSASHTGIVDAFEPFFYNKKMVNNNRLKGRDAD
jgi:hypothetical protein